MNLLISRHIVRPFLLKNFLHIHVPPSSSSSSLILKRFSSSNNTNNTEKPLNNKNDYEKSFKEFERNEKNRLLILHFI